jgi:multisubunit Na+/H+ antiporter MnhG subunit
MNRTHITTAAEIIGAGLVVIGIASWSIPGACIAAGILLILAGGLAA